MSGVTFLAARRSIEASDRHHTHRPLPRSAHGERGNRRVDRRAQRREPEREECAVAAEHDVRARRDRADDGRAATAAFPPPQPPPPPRAYACVCVCVVQVWRGVVWFGVVFGGANLLLISLGSGQRPAVFLVLKIPPFLSTALWCSGYVILVASCCVLRYNCNSFEVLLLFLFWSFHVPSR